MKLLLCFSLLAVISTGNMEAHAPKERPEVSPPH